MQHRTHCQFESTQSAAKSSEKFKVKILKSFKFTSHDLQSIKSLQSPSERHNQIQLKRQHTKYAGRVMRNENECEHSREQDVAEE